jgi:hypothetical protein
LRVRRRGAGDLGERAVAGGGDHRARAAAGFDDAGRLQLPVGLGERYHRIARRRGKKKAIVAVGRSILVIIWHLLSNPDVRYTDLGSDHYAQHIDPERRKRAHIHQLEALGYKVTLEPTA